jgi:hypothetical protein
MKGSRSHLAYGWIFIAVLLHPRFRSVDLMLERSHDGNDKDLGGGRQPLRTPSDVKLVLVSRMIKDKRPRRMDRTGNIQAT